MTVNTFITCSAFQKGVTFLFFPEVIFLNHRSGFLAILNPFKSCSAFQGEGTFLKDSQRLLPRRLVWYQPSFSLVVVDTFISCSAFLEGVTFLEGYNVYYPQYYVEIYVPVSLLLSIHLWVVQRSKRKAHSSELQRLLPGGLLWNQPSFPLISLTSMMSCSAFQEEGTFL